MSRIIKDPAAVAINAAQLGLSVNAQGVFNVNAMRANAQLLQKDEWVDLDRTVVEVVRKQLNGVADLRSRGLVYNLGGLGVLTAEWENTSAMNDADVDMTGAPGREDSVDFTTQGVPVPIIHKDYRIPFRRLEASRRMGSSIDTVQAGEAARRVALRMENILFNGYNLKSDGYNLYGYTTFPSRMRTNIGTAWDASSPTIIADVMHMIEKMNDASFYGPFIIYVPTNYYTALMKDYDTYKDGTWLQRILDIPMIEAVKPTAVLASNEVLMVQLTSNVVDLAIGQDVTNVPWESRGGMVQHMMVMAAMAPRIKTTEDEDGNTVCGIVHAFEAATSTTTTA